MVVACILLYIGSVSCLDSHTHLEYFVVTYANLFVHSWLLQTCRQDYFGMAPASYFSFHILQCFSMSYMVMVYVEDECVIIASEVSQV